MEKTKEFDKAWKKTCPTCKDNPNNIFYYKRQCSDCEDKKANDKKYTYEDMKRAFFNGNVMRDIDEFNCFLTTI